MTVTQEQEDARQRLRDIVAQMKAQGFQPTSMRMLPATAIACAIEVNTGGFGEFEGIRIKAAPLYG